MKYMQNIVSYSSLISRDDRNNKKTYSSQATQTLVNKYLQILKWQNFKEVFND
jgi:hypothetical protein